jgi:membrane protein DedA with SNARE-associated domain
MEHFLTTWGYLALFLLAVGESACIPIPSEVTMTFAGALAGGLVATGRLNLPAVILVGTVGELGGAFIAWGVGVTGGRVLVERYGRFVLLTKKDLERAENWFSRNGDWGVLVGRLLPVIRTFVSLPAGIAEMKPVRFGVFTVIGSLVWDSVLAGIGYEVGSRWQQIAAKFTDVGYVVVAVAVLAVVAFMAHRLREVVAERRSMAD